MVALLNDVGQLVGNQSLTCRVARAVVAGTEHDRISRGVGFGADIPRRCLRCSAGMNPNTGKVIPEPALHVLPERHGQRLTRGSQSLLHAGWRSIERIALMDAARALDDRCNVLCRAPILGGHHPLGDLVGLQLHRVVSRTHDQLGLQPWVGW
ncbi:MAG: hypothetical protein A3G82_17395 [Burkholderiales bacterium RIFCSPLOWO2_12_FULL_67_210]|nr:MAG: hypothetical protein A3G82_17395 [Burkholderiales bacterium RIFCSPLOWO2_12_FULL_67_210]